MKKKGGFLLAIVLLVFSQQLSAAPLLRAGSSDADVVKLVEARFAKGQEPPFSFVLDEVPSSEFIRTWKQHRELISSSNELVTLRYTHTNPENTLRAVADVKVYPAFRAFEWVVNFENTSPENSGQLSEVKVLDLTMSYPQGGNFKFHYAEGNKISREDYAPRTLTLRTGEPLTLSPESGRSSEGEFPFFNIESSESHQGMMLAIGWTGTWALQVEKVNPKYVHIATGQKFFDSYLLPGESFRTPSVAVLLWQGDRMTGHNMFRRLIIKHHTRTIDGKVDYPLCSGFNYRDPAPYGEYSAITESWAVAMIERYAQFGVLPDVFWMDAGWHTGADDYEHGQNWASTTGNWTVDKKRFPNGLKPISDAAHKYGAKYMVWFEPERVVRGTQWSKEHVQWMLEAQWPEGSEESSWQLFDLSKDDACDWLSKYYGDMIEENGIDYYRQDCNIRPAKYWAAADEPKRIGMIENKYISNLYKFWDYLLSRFPGLLIDNCASGGKRLDWETIGRTAPLWRSDYYHYDDPDGYQCHTYGLNFFLPIHGTGILLTDKYSFRSSLCSTLVYNWKVTEPEYSYIDMQQRIKEYREIKPYYYEDYYPLSGTGDLSGNDVWLAYQMHRPDDDSGIVVAFRRELSQETDYLVHLGGLTSEAEYEILDVDMQSSTVLSGKELSDGFKLHLDNPKSSLLIKYKRK